MRLLTGEPAPQFKCSDIHGESFSLEALRGRKLLLILPVLQSSRARIGKTCASVP